MKSILIPGAGGSPATNFVRSLRAAPEKFNLIGTDCDKFYILRAETDQRFLVPRASELDYFDVMNDIIDETKAEFMHIQNDVEIGIISKNREKLNIRTYLPSKSTVEKCLNKLESYKCWKAAGIKQPETMLLRDEEDLKKALDSFGKVWIRDTTGAGGRGSIAVTDFRMAKSWIDFKNGWNVYTAAECLQEQSITWQSIWKEGELIIAQGRKRLYWELGKVSPSGISGATGTGITVSDHTLDEIAQKAVYAIDKEPHGIFSVDLTYDLKGIPNPTEINIGRFFTTHEFFTRAGLNMPHILVKLAYGETLPKIPKKINPLKNNLAWIRGIDFLPVYTTLEAIDENVKKLQERRKKLGS